MDNFIVSARKYRPATFVSVVGQSHITSTLKNAIARGQLAHAYLFCGPRGVGKTTCARIFAKAINCLSPRDNEPCGECESCRAFDEGRSMNVHELDAASNNSVDDIRALTEQVRVPPQIGRYSVYIIDEVHMLSQAAFNAFLKTLEEPPAHAIFILATTEKHKILPTILSRCQIYDFNRIRVEDAVGYLKHIAANEGIEYDDESLNLIAAKADGGMRDALSMFDKAVAFCGNRLDFRDVARTLNVLDYDTYFRLTDMAAAGDYRSALVMFDEVLRKGFSAQTFTGGLAAHLRDLLMCKDAATAPLLEATGTLLERYRGQSAGLDTTFLFDAVSLINGVDSSLRTAMNQRLHVELGLMKLCGMGRGRNSLEPPVVPLPVISGASTTPAAPATPAVTKSTVAATDASVRARSDEEQEAARSRSGQTAESRPVAAGVTHAPSVAAEPRNADSPAAQGSGRPLSGLSINGILNGTSRHYGGDAGGDAQQTVAQEADPDSEAKIVAARDEFLARLGRVRPRLATAFSGMRVSGNRIACTVPTDVLRSDIMQHQKEIYALLRQVSGITGPVEFEVEVREDKTSLRPVKAEDKLAYLRGKNAALDELRREFELEIE